MKPSLLFVILFCAGALPAQEGKELVARSQSGQFIVHGQRKSASRIVLPTRGGAGPFLFPATHERENSDETVLPLDPALVAVACDRVKQSLISTFGLDDNWSNPIHVFIDPALQQGQVAFDTIPMGRGWLFRLALPPEMRELDLDRLILHATLVERSNRNRETLANNVPKWLTEGLIPCLRGASPDGLSIQRLASFRFRPPPEIALRDTFRRQAPLSFEEMGWPDGLEPSRRAVFAASAELFVYELLHVKDGRACLGAMILKSPNYLNWQLAFQDAFQTHFRNLVEVEKWWSLTWVHVLGVDPSQRWDSEDGWQKFEATLRTTVEIRDGDSGAPVRRTLTLQAAIRELPIDVQEKALESRLFLLRLIQLHMPPRVAEMALEYQKVLGGYLADMATVGRTPAEKRFSPVSLRTLKPVVISKLDLLDRKRARLKAQLQPWTESAALAP